MQATPTSSEYTAELLKQRVRLTERLFLAADHMAVVRLDAQETRCRAITLREEVRQRRDILVAKRAAFEQMLPRLVQVAPPLAPRQAPRVTARIAEPLDLARDHLHKAYAANRTPAIRAQLMASYDGFARSLALKFRHRESVDDLVQVARVGLLHAIDRFDPDLGRPFPLFARITITGELKRHLRDKTWGMRVPRSLQEDYLNVMRAVDELTAERSDSPSMEAIAARCGISVERVLETLELRVSQRPLSIDGPVAPGSDEPGIELGREDIGFGQLENRDLLGQLLGRLPERDRRILELRFFDELTQAEIAEQVGVSQMCVSRVLARTLGRLRLWARTALN